MKRAFLFTVMLILGALAPLSAQDTEPEETAAPQKKASAYRSEALQLVREKKFDAAILLLEEALALYPDDQDIIGLIKSVGDLKQLENPVFGDDPPPLTEEPSYDKQDKPDFAVTVRDPDKTGSGEKSRNTVVLDVGIKSMTPLGPLDDPLTFLSPPQTALGASADIRYYFPFFRKLIGLGLWYEGYFTNFDDQDFSGLLFHQGGLNLLIRNFPIENEGIRSELSLELGSGITFFRDNTLEDDTIYYRLLMQVALYGEDPLLYRLLNYEGLQSLYFKGGVRFFYYFVENTNMVRYRLGLAIRPHAGKDHWEAGIYFHLEDMDISDWSLSSWGIILGAGFRF